MPPPNQHPFVWLCPIGEFSQHTSIAQGKPLLHDGMREIVGNMVFSSKAVEHAIEHDMVDMLVLVQEGSFGKKLKERGYGDGKSNRKRE